MPLAMTTSNLILVNQLRNRALKASRHFNALRFFADTDYAEATLVELAVAGDNGLRQLAESASTALFAPPVSVPARVASGSPEATDAASATRRFVIAKETMNSLAVDAAGLRSFFFVLKLERCNSLRDLAALLDNFQRLVTAGAGKVIGFEITKHMRLMLA